MYDAHYLENYHFSSAILKIAARCNLFCKYCYWFRDKDVYTRPKLLEPDAEAAFLEKLERHIRQHKLKSFSVILHGGEPLLFPKKRFIKLCQSIHAISARCQVPIPIGITTNGSLITEEWARILRILKVRVTISIDGPKKIHDKNRVDHKGRGSFEKVIRGLSLLRAEGIEPGVLAVCNPDQSPDDLYRFFTDELGLRSFDVLIPDFTHDEAEQMIPIASYYERLYRLWASEPDDSKVKIRVLDNFVRGSLGAPSKTDSIGYGPVQSLTVLTDGALEPLDVLHITGDGATRTELNVKQNELDDLKENALWLKAYKASLELPKQCQTCEFRSACGGGYLPSRFSKENGFNNPSVYCDDLKQIFRSVQHHLSSHITVRQVSQEQNDRTPASIPDQYGVGSSVARASA